MGKSRKKLKVKNVAAPVSLPPTKASKKDKRSVEEAPYKLASCKKLKKETEQKDQNKKKVKKLKKALIESPGEKKDDGRSSDFEEEFAAALITVPPMKAVAKGKRRADEATEKHASSKNQIIEAEVGQSKKMVKKLKTLNESPGKRKDETRSLDFEGEISGASKTKSVRAAKKKPESNDVSFKNDSDDEDCVDELIKSKPKTSVAVSKKKANSSDSSSESDSGEVVKETGNQRWDSLPDGAKNKEISIVSEKELETPAKRNEESGIKRLFVGNLPPEVIKDDLLEFFAKAGKVTEVRLATKEDGNFRGFGHVEFVTEAGAQAALRMNGRILLGRPLIVDLARERGSNNYHAGMVNDSYRIGAKNPAHTVYVKGFGKSLEEDQIRNLLKEHFGSHGEIIRVSIPQDNKTGRSKGFAYVLFNDQATASKALELNGSELGGYTLTVQEPTPKSGTRDGAYSGRTGGGRRSASLGGGHDGGGRGCGKGGMEPGASYNRSVTTASEGLLSL